MSEPRALVEHFFRHEFGRLDLVEDVVQAVETWSRRGVPPDPAGWIYRTARNLAIEAAAAHFLAGTPRAVRQPAGVVLPRNGYSGPSALDAIGRARRTARRRENA